MLCFFFFVVDKKQIITSHKKIILRPALILFLHSLFIVEKNSIFISRS